jgi:hypothetical protein
MTTESKDPVPTAGSDAVEGATSSSNEGEPATVTAEKEQDDFHPGFRLYAIIVGLGVTTLLAALENTVVTVAAPVILTDLKLGKNYIWIINAFFLCRCVFKVQKSADDD